MGRGKSTPGTDSNKAPFDTNKDRYPSIKNVVQRVLQEEDFPSGNVERLEVTCLASGEATWRVWPARAEDFIGGYYGDPNES